MRLLGPQPFDPLAPDRAARELIARFVQAPDGMEVGDGSVPGLYLLVDDDHAVRGFWVSVSESWLDDGAAGGVTPPFAKGLLDAATEELWWQRLKVAPRVLDAWRPVIVVEWPPWFADRCALPPPGVSLAETPDADVAFEDDEDEMTDIGSWLQPPAVFEPVDDEDTGPQRAIPFRNLPAKRSVLCILRGSLRRANAVHEGRFELVCMSSPSEEGMGLASIPRAWRSGIPLEDWLEEAAAETLAPPAEHQLGYPLRLPGDRVGFPMSGWLTRDLEIYPPRPADAAVGILVPRDTRNPLWGQIGMALLVTLFVLGGTLTLSGAVHWLQQPVIERAAAPIALAPQPAISVCSADHPRFIERFRCHVAHLAEGGSRDDADCGDVPADVDLQAAYCGLRDRDLDGRGSEDGFPWADLAAAQACFDVLGQPYEYALRGSRGRLADPPALLEDQRLKINALVAVVDELDAACHEYRQKLELKVSGAILATHVGSESDEGDALQDLAFSRASTGMNSTIRQCFEAGRTEGVLGTTAWRNLCGPLRGEARWDEAKAWQELGGVPPDDDRSLVGRYTAARFGQRAPQQDLWDCHDRLARGAPAQRDVARWELPIAVPGDHRDRGVSTQIQLDAWLLSLRMDNASTNACWREVDRMLGTYEPVHPLLAEAPATWPSEEQQVCGQVCAAAYRIDPVRGSWVTPSSDLSVCLDDGPPPTTAAYRAGEGRLDRLRMPWHDDPNGEWVPPDESAICAFNLLAQGRLPTVLPDNITAPLWAGELASGTGIAGGEAGAAAASAEALSRYGSNRSTATCGYAAAQCFTTEMLDVLGDDRFGPHEWRDVWRRNVRGIARATNDQLGGRPWCRLVRPYVSSDGQLPEGELDFPCAYGVEQVRRNVEDTIQSLASGRYRGMTP